MSCDRNICMTNEYNGIGCDECCVSYDTAVQREQDDYDSGFAKAIESVLEIIHQKGISNAYDRPSFWYNKGKDYKVIDTKYHRGYDQALEDVEEEVLALRKENRNETNRR